MHSFSPNCTLPPEGTNFVGSPPVRGTLQILWSSLSVLILCTWTLQHLNIPPHTIARTKWQKLRRTASRLLVKLGWMLFNVLSPEWIFTKACIDWISVRQMKTRFAEQAEEDGVPWTNAHIHFANMGGFGISFQHLVQEDQRGNADAKTPPEFSSVEESIPVPAANDLDPSVLKGWEWAAWIRKINESFGDFHGEYSLDHAKRILTTSISSTEGLQIDSHNSKLIFSMPIAQAVKERLAFIESRDSVCTNLLLLRANLWILDAAQLLEARRLGIIKTLPYIEEDDLGDRGNDNFLVKLLAAGQTSWFILQFIIRFCNGQPNTQLEVMVVAFAISSMITYFFLWNRPKEAEYTLFAKAEKYPDTGISMVRIAVVGPQYWITSLRRSIWIANSQMHQIHAFGVQTTEEFSAYIIAAIMLVFGALHCLAWNFGFPTRIEQIMWQVSSLVTVLAPVVSLIGYCTVYEWSKERESKLWATLSICLGLLSTFIPPLLIIAARLFILVEVFRTLVFQPSGAFEVTWLSFLPHFG